MNRYYKNWYQHYLELEEQKEHDVMRGYYTNLIPKENEAITRIPERLQEEKRKIPAGKPYVPVRKQKKGFHFLGVLLPIATILGFLFLWYQIDVGPIRHLVNEAFIFVGIREETVDVISYHTSLLNQHVEFAEKVAAYINGENELSFADLDSLYEEIRATHMRVVEVSGDEGYAEALRLWSFKIASTNQMMNDLIFDSDVKGAHEQFIADQQAIAALIKAELLTMEGI